MKLKKLCICSFRNIDNAQLFPDERFTIIVGKNAQGKTNILESIYLLGTMKSFRMSRNSDLIKYGSPYSVLKGWVDREGITREIALSIENSGKKVKVDNKAVAKPADFFGCLNMTIFSPEDLAMVRGMPELRRRYLDRAIFSGDIRYLTVYHDYHRLLKHRNSMLKSGVATGLDIWNEKLAEAGARLIVLRACYLQEISELLAEFYATIAGLMENAEIRYRSEAAGNSLTADSTEKIRLRLLEIFSKNIADEIRKGTTIAGPHRDDMEFSLNGRILKVHGSQGEQRSFILALKMAEIEYIKRRYGNPPVLLLDDMTSELDTDRNHNFMEFIKSKDMQVFITTTSVENLGLTGINNYTVFPVHGGKIVQ